MDRVCREFDAKMSANVFLARPNSPLAHRITSGPWCPIGDKCHPGARHSVQMVNPTVAVLTRMVLPCLSPTGAHPELTSGRSLYESGRFCGREAVGS